MLKALVWKEWRQLALVRWGGLALGAVLPIAMLAGAELARRGLIPNGGRTEFDTRVSMHEALPAALALGLWPLIALMLAAQSFGGDRAAGTDAFLLERPVPRASIWWARAGASIACLVVVIVGTSAIAYGAASLAGPPKGAGWSQWLDWQWGGLAVALIAWIGASLAAALLSSPMAAVLLGALLGAIPVGLAALLAALFPFARINQVPLALPLCILLLPAFVYASWRATNRGEPAGGGRVKRALGTIGIAVLAVPCLFAAMAPAVMRFDAGVGLHDVVSNDQGTAASVMRESWSGGWLVAAPSGRRLRFFPPPVREAVWSADGSTMAVTTWAGRLGGTSNAQRIELVDGSDGHIVRSVETPEHHPSQSMLLADGAVVAVLFDESQKEPMSEVYVLGKDSPAWKATGFRRFRTNMNLVGPMDDGRVYVQITQWGTGDDSVAPTATHWYPVDPKAATVGAEIPNHAPSEAYWMDRRRGGVSPSGRYEVVRLPGREGYGVADMATGTPIAREPIPRMPRWLAGDRLIWIEWSKDARALLVADVGGPPRTLRRWSKANTQLLVSPDGSSAFISARPVDPSQPEEPSAKALSSAPPDSVEAGDVPEELLFVTAGDRVRKLGTPFATESSTLRFTAWAGPKTLARIAPGVVAFEDIDSRGKRRYVLGSERDLR